VVPQFVPSAWFCRPARFFFFFSYTVLDAAAMCGSCSSEISFFCGLTTPTTFRPLRLWPAIALLVQWRDSAYPPEFCLLFCLALGRVHKRSISSLAGAFALYWKERPQSCRFFFPDDRSSDQVLYNPLTLAFPKYGRLALFLRFYQAERN